MQRGKVDGKGEREGGERCGVMGRGGRWKEVGKDVAWWGEEREREGGEMEGDRMGRGEGGTNVLLVGDNGNVLHGHLQGTYFVVATSLHSCDLLTQ